MCIRQKLVGLNAAAPPERFDGSLPTRTCFFDRAEAPVVSAGAALASTPGRRCFFG